MNEPTPRRITVRGIFTTVLVFLGLGPAVANGLRPSDLLVIIGLLCVPLACIHFGSKRLRFVEWIGWILLVVWVALLAGAI